MQITAQIKLNSHIHKSWSHANFIRREFLGVLFEKVKGGQFVGIVGDVDISVLQNHPCVELELSTVTLHAPEELSYIEKTTSYKGNDEDVVVSEAETILATPRRGRPKKIV